MLALGLHRRDKMPDIQPYIPYLAYAAVALVGLVLLILLLRAFGRRARGRKGLRLGVVEYCEVDQTRRLVLVRRDDVEHLVMIGGHQDLLVEGNIGTDQLISHSASPQMREPVLTDDVAPIRPPRAPVFGAARRPILRPVVNPPQDDEPT